MNLKIKYLYTICISFLLTAQSGYSQSAEKTKDALPRIKVSKNQHYFITEDEKPFFWLGDTGWLAFGKLDRESINKYFQDRKAKGFNVVQVMVLHNINAVNVYGDAALINEDVSKPLTTAGNNFNNKDEYDYWDHVDFTLDVAQKNGIYVAMVPVWGTNVSKGNKVSKEQAEKYAKFLADRYKNRTNVIWLNGGDTHGNEFMDIWNAIGNTLKTNNPDQLVTFHPFGRTDSSENYHNASWLDFNMFQSGHRRYDQDSIKTNFKEDNYKFVQRDLTLKPTKPTLDGEPSYEGIPHGLHDTLQPKWTENDVRRYGYWSVFAGAAGYTYGHNAVMQMFRKGDKPAYGNKELWNSAINAPGAGQMVYIKKLMLSFPYLERIPDQTLITNQGEKYDYLVATKGEKYALIYTYNGRKMILNMGKIAGDKVNASWYNPRNGKETKIGIIENKGTKEFQPLGDKKDGNDWVLILRTK
ncbi:glycoside hydrolase family 140 protein [Flavobacterium pectinovorum]|uniref:Collagen-binding domain of a collagenase n=1 Tax=Flavobacterium pectinovorum TaxID=29533 RepID=A0AB36P5D4_9FLAO|nr:glycoside hydrolase family 140 protein [Flavobacterium pectinovorum]OXB07426.1 glycoside hydrolase [Flavobacterium pectinovorum]SHM66393.1 Putative collagen-binding domain of a collagenase [Flavobacterium pectinovorum]